MILAAEYPFLEIVGTMIVFFLWIAWIWILVMVLSDVFRSEMSGWGMAGWAIFVVLLPFLGVFVYLVSHGKELSERRMRDEQAAMAGREAMRGGSGNGAAAEITEGKRLLDAGVIDEAEFAQLKRNVLV